MHINVIFDQSALNAPAEFRTAMLSAARYIEQQYTDNFTFNLHVGYGTFGPNAAPIPPDGVAINRPAVSLTNYTQLRNALIADARTDDDSTAVATLPVNNPNSSSQQNIYVTRVQAAALGLVPATTVVDEYIGFNSNLPFDYNRADGITANHYDFYGVAINEITNVMGRVLGVGGDTTGGGFWASYAMDFFHYSAPGVRSFQRGGYFSFDNGNTNLGNFNTTGSHDAGDWTKNIFDSYTAASPTGDVLAVTLADLRVMDVIGYDFRYDVGGDANFATLPSGFSSTVNQFSVAGTIDWNDDTDWYQVSLNADQRYRFDLNGVDGGGGTLPDPIVRIYNASSQFLAANDDSGPGFDSELWFTAPAGGFYFVEAAGWNSGSSGTYTLHFTRDDYEGDSSTFGEMAVNSSATGEIEVARERDWLGVYLTAGTSYRFNLAGLPDDFGSTATALRNPHLRLYDHSSNLLAFNDDNTAVTGLNSQLFFTPGTSDVYYIEASGVGNGRGHYIAHVTIDDRAGDTSTTGSLTVGNSLSIGNVEVGLDRDWFRVPLTAGVSYTFTVGGLSLSDPNLSLWTNSERVGFLTLGPYFLASDDDSGPGADARLIYRPSETAFHFADVGGFAGDPEIPVSPFTGSYAVRADITRSSSDFDHNGVSDVLFRNNSTGNIGFYQLNIGGTSWRNIGGSSTAYSAAGIGDFNGDTVSDVLFRNNATGHTGFYQLNGDGTLQGWRDIGPSSTAYRVAGVGDFNGDTVSDVLFRNNSTGDLGFYQMNFGGTFEGWHGIGSSSTAYGVVGVGDFNGNGVSDILFRHNGTGNLGFYQLNSGGTLQGWHNIGASSTAYSVVGIGDFNGNTVSDILFRNNSTGDTGFYQLHDNGTLQGWHHIGPSSTAYSVVGVGDYDGSGVSDILFRNNSTGDTGFYAMNRNGTLQGWSGVGASSTAYQTVA